MIGKILKVAQREYIETVKTKTFLVSILLTPVLIGAVLLLTRYLQKETFSGPRPPRHIAVMNLSDSLSAELDSVFAGYNESQPQRQIILKQYTEDDPASRDTRVEEGKNEVRDGKLEACLVIDQKVLEGAGRLHFYTKKVTDFEFSSTVRRLVNDAVFNSRFRQHGLSPQLIAELRRGVPFDEVDLSAKSEKKRDKMAMFMVPFFFLMLMFFGIFATSQGLLMSVIEEKTSRVIEQLLSSVSPFQLMAGKILGQSGVGFTLVSLYGAAAYGTAAYRGMADVATGGIIVYFIIYFVLGFLLISSMLAAVGSACNTIKESQNLMGPIMILLMLPMIAWFFIAQHPEATLSIVLSFIPPITPMVMVIRIAAQPDLAFFQIFASIVLLALSVPAVMWASAKIFRTGILMYGKPPSLREILRWLRYD
ncbi:MAG TPA: ABC transporter permease [archaeon]|nr:ABC transporter permease [archaeon]